MPAEQAVREGNLQEALEELQEQVRADPANAKHRTFLFQLLAVRGEWNRALVQLNVAGELDPSALPMVQTYRAALQCEFLRADIFQGKRSPLVFGEPAEWLALLIEALRLTGEGHHERSQELRGQAFEAAPASPGNIDGQSFQWIADADSRLGPVIEAIVNGRYYWIPFCNIREVEIEEPADLRDIVWTPAYFTWANGGRAPALLHARYPGSEASGDPQIQLSRRTEWHLQEGDLHFGYGQRMLATDTDEYPLMQARKICLEPTGGLRSTPEESLQEA